MKDIPGEAISFDMYYMAKDPVPLAGEKREMPVIETMPVNDGTPVFRNFYISDIVCNGAEKAIFVRGIPEMNVRNIQFRNMVMTTKKGIECTEGTNIRFSNIKLVAASTDPLIYLQNSQGIMFDNISYDKKADLLFSVNGERSGNIKVAGSVPVIAKEKISFNYGAVNSSVEFK